MTISKKASKFQRFECQFQKSLANFKICKTNAKISTPQGNRVVPSTSLLWELEFLQFLQFLKFTRFFWNCHSKLLNLLGFFEIGTRNFGIYYVFLKLSFETLEFTDILEFSHLIEWSLALVSCENWNFCNFWNLRCFFEIVIRNFEIY